jgi:hypothetical protein
VRGRNHAAAKPKGSTVKNDTTASAAAAKPKLNRSEIFEHIESPNAALIAATPLKLPPPALNKTMTITITLHTDNAAFDDFGVGAESSRIIREAASVVAVAMDAADIGPRYQRTLRDTNGYYVGSLVIEEES